MLKSVKKCLKFLKNVKNVEIPKMSENVKKCEKM